MKKYFPYNVLKPLPFSPPPPPHPLAHPTYIMISPKRTVLAQSLIELLKSIVLMRFLKMFGVSDLLAHVSSVSFAPNVGPG